MPCMMGHVCLSWKTEIQIYSKSKRNPMKEKRGTVHLGMPRPSALIIKATDEKVYTASSSPSFLTYLLLQI